eukprot:3968703-Pyramimonas_sp.AAC.1
MSEVCNPIYPTSSRLKWKGALIRKHILLPYMSKRSLADYLEQEPVNATTLVRKLEGLLLLVSAPV